MIIFFGCLCIYVQHFAATRKSGPFANFLWNSFTCMFSMSFFYFLFLCFCVCLFILSWQPLYRFWLNIYVDSTVYLRHCFFFNFWSHLKLLTMILHLNAIGKVWLYGTQMMFHFFKPANEKEVTDFIRLFWDSEENI